MSLSLRTLMPLVLAAAALGACDKKSEGGGGAPAGASAAPTAKALPTPAAMTMFKPLMAASLSKDSEAVVNLGRQLYYDPRLSKNQDISCNSCHDLARYGVDGEKTSPGHKKARGDRNSPTTYNSYLHFRQFWDGRAADVEEQATGPMMNPVEMAMVDEPHLVAVLSSIPEYVDAFKKAYPKEETPISLKNAGRAIGAFERGLTTPSRFDKFLGGDKGALTDAERQGLADFIDTGCTTCHVGQLLGGDRYQKLGLVKPWPNQTDQGRFKVTNKEDEKMFFKVPTLRNVEKTPPYFHDGSAASLDEAVRLMASHQLGRDLPADKVTSIVTFLKSLTGEVPAAYIKQPELPKSTPKTPKPDPALRSGPASAARPGVF